METLFSCAFSIFFSFCVPRRVISVTTSLKEGRTLPGKASSGPISDLLNALCKNFANWSRTKFRFFRKSVVIGRLANAFAARWQWIDSAIPLLRNCDGRGRQPLLNKLYEAWQDAFFHCCGKRAILRDPAKTTQFGIAYTLVTGATFGLSFRFSDRRDWTIHSLRQPAITLALQNGLIVNHVVNLTRQGCSIQQEKKCACDIIPMHLVNKAIVFWINHRCAGKKFGQ